MQKNKKNNEDEPGLNMKQPRFFNAILRKLSGEGRYFMWHSGIYRKIDKHGRISIPKETRFLTGLTAGSTYIIILKGDYAVATLCDCIFCGDKDAKIEFKGRKVCKRCLATCMSDI